jgi:methylene-tetrahydromethanopterin dehydrogenase
MANPEKPAILHMFTPTRNMSPFDVNMAIDAGYEHIATYGDMSVADVTALTQDAIFSRGPKGVARTGIFIGGRDIEMADDMLRAAKAAMTPPFVVSVFADPSGAFTTAGAAVATLERAIAGAGGFASKSFLILGGTGPVGAAAAVLGARLGAKVQLASHLSVERAKVTTDMIAKHYDAAIEPVCADGAAKRALIANADVILASAKAGVQVLSQLELADAGRLLAAADLNAVPPAGIEGLGFLDDRKPLASAYGKTVGIGALAVGQVKYQTQRRLFERMLAGTPVFIDFRDAFDMAQAICRE